MADGADLKRATEDEPEGGDPPCWAHLFDDEPDCDEEQSRPQPDPDLRLTSRTEDDAIHHDRIRHGRAD